MKKLFLFLMMAVMLSGVKAQEQVTIGTGTQYSNYMAIPGYFGYHSSAYLYTSDEMPQGRSNNLFFVFRDPECVCGF